MSPRSLLIWRGILAVIIGLIAVVWPGITVYAFVILFAVYAFSGAVTSAIRGFGSARAGRVAGYLLLALFDLAAGVVALVWPGITALALVWLVAIWALVGGIVEVALAFGDGETAGERTLFALGGLVTIALGVVIALRPGIGAVTLVQVFGLFSIVGGISAFVLAANLGRLGRKAEDLVTA